MLLQRPGRLVALLEEEDCSITPFEGWVGVTTQANNKNHAPRGAWLKLFLCVFQQARFSRDPVGWWLCWRSEIARAHLLKGGLVLTDRQIIKTMPLEGPD